MAVPPRSLPLCPPTLSANGQPQTATTMGAVPPVGPLPGCSATPAQSPRRAGPPTARRGGSGDGGSGGESWRLVHVVHARVAKNRAPACAKRLGAAATTATTAAATVSRRAPHHLRGVY